jgi:hypothetical protein
MQAGVMGMRPRPLARPVEETVTSDLTGQELVDAMSRTHLLLAHLGVVGEIDDAAAWLSTRGMHLQIGSAACRSEFAQAAASTAVTLARRASLRVSVALEDPHAIMHVGPLRATEISNALTLLGAEMTAPSTDAIIVSIGDVAAFGRLGNPGMQITWDGWVAAVRRLGERPGCILAAIAAGALAVSEVFQHHLGNVDALWRDVTVSLWEPLSSEPERAVGPTLTRLPDNWMLVGLGHLGQAHAWCIGHLPYREGTGEVWLVDDDVVSLANVSTGILTEPIDVSSPQTQKTRLVSKVLESLGRPTRMLEYRLPSSYRWTPGHPDVALVGVDNVELRRSLSAIGWPLCVDVGLGSTRSSFSAISLHAFPGSQSSSEIASWHVGRRAVNEANLAPAFVALGIKSGDQCGVIMLAGQAVAAAFVGTVAACLAVTEPLRRLHGASGVEALGVSLDLLRPRGANANGHSRVRLGSVGVQDRLHELGNARS